MPRSNHLPFLSAVLFLLSVPSYGATPIPENAFMASMDDEASQMKVNCKMSNKAGAIDCDFLQIAISPSDAKQQMRQELAKPDTNLDHVCKADLETGTGDSSTTQARKSALKTACAQSDKAKRRESIAAVAATLANDCTATLSGFSLTFRWVPDGKWVSTQTSPCGFTTVSELIPEVDKKIKNTVFWSYTQVRVGTVSEDDQFCKSFTLNKPTRSSWRGMVDNYNLTCTTFKLNIQ